MTVNEKIQYWRITGGTARRVVSRTNRVFGYVLIKLIRLYQITLSPWIGNQCRFYPSCSHYAQEAISTHGPWRGGLLAARRLSRCHPYNAGGVDLVPECKGFEACAKPAPLPTNVPTQPVRNS